MIERKGRLMPEQELFLGSRGKQDQNQQNLLSQFRLDLEDSFE